MPDHDNGLLFLTTSLVIQIYDLEHDSRCKRHTVFALKCFRRHMLLEICSKCEILLKCCPKCEKVRKGAQNAKWCSNLKKVLKRCSAQSLIVFPSDIWCKINKLLKYYEYQLTKRCLEVRLEGFKVSFMVSNEIMILVEYRIAKKCHDFHYRCR